MLMTTLPTNAVAERLIARGRRPKVLGAVSASSTEALAASLFDALTHASNGADGIDLSLSPHTSPTERLTVADQLAEATGIAVYVRSEVPMALGSHTLILPAEGGRLRAGAAVVRDLGIDSGAWPHADDDEAFLVATAGFGDLNDAALMGLASLASFRGAAAISTDRVRLVRRVVDTLAPLHQAGPRSQTTPNRGAPPCR